WVNSGTLSLLQNTSTSGSISTSSFTSAISLPVGANPASLAVADLNNDGKPDLVAANTFDGSLSVIQYYPVSAQHLPYAPSSASISRGSFVSTDLMDMEWKQEAPTGYAIAPDDGTTINAAGTAANNAGRFAYFWAMGSRTPLVRVQGNLTFTAKGNGAITVVILATNDLSVQASTTFTLTSSYQNFNWALTSLYPQQEYIIGVIFKGGSGTPQVNGQFKKNFCLTLRQAGLNDNFIRFRGDSTSLIGNSEKTWYGWSDVANAPRKKYLQHSAYARMRFITSATHLAIEYVRDFYDKHVLNLFASNQTIAPCNWDSAGNVVYTGSGAVNAINVYTRVTGGQTYTISGLKTTYPTYVWFQNGMPMGPPGYLSNVGTTAAPLYQVTAPVGATNLGLLVQRISDPSYAADPLNDSFQVYTNCMVQQGAIGTMTPLDGTVPSAFALFNGSAPSKISGPAVFINGSLYKYYQLDGNDLAKQVQIITDDLPAGSKTVEVMMPGEGTYLPANPHTRRAGTYLRAVYFADTTTTVASDTTRATGSVCFIHDSIISGFNISSDAQNNVWMMKLKRDPTFGFSGDVFSEGYAGRILHTDTSTPDSLEAFAQKLASFKVNTYWFQVGVNDYGFLTPLYSFYSEYKTLVERLRVLRPSAKIYIQSTGPESYEGPNGETYADDGLTTTGPAANDYRDVQRAIATSHSYCEYVNFEGLFAPTIDNVSDGIHPTDVGNSLYASGVKTKSSLLGTAPAGSSLAFYRSSTRHLIKTIQGIYVITATGGTAPYTFTLLSGTLSSGLTFHSDGTITGIPATNGTVSLSVKVTDAVAANVTQSFTLTVDNTPSIVVAPLNIIDAKVGTGYKKTFRGLGGHGHYTYSVTSGALPTGLTLNSTSGTLTGTPSASGNSSFTLTATDHWGFTGNTAHTLHVGTVTPVALTDSFKVTATVTDSNHLILQGHLHDYYSQLLYTYVAAYFTPAGGSETLIGGNFANVPAGTKDGPAVDFGGMALTPGNFSVRLQTTAISPGTLDSVNINYGTQIQSMYTSHSSPTDSITYTISINSGGHLLVTGHIPRLHSNVVYTYIGAYIQQSSSSYLSGQNVNISAGSLTSSPVDFGQITTVPSGSFTVTLANGGVFPSGMDGYNFVYAANTYFTRTRTW
ncbi:MAG: putative Ig domain-containing protein, partial [Mucilaginibacter sp.]